MSAEATAIWVSVLGNMLLAGLASFIGVLAYLQKRSLTSDAVAHAALPGICIAFLVVGRKDFISLSIGAFVFGLIALLVINKLSKADQGNKADTAIALTLTTFFALGIFLLTYIQHEANGSQSGLDKFLFGKAASLLEQDVVVYFVFGVIALAATMFFYKPILYSLFDEHYLQTVGYPVKVFRGLSSALLIVAVLLGIQSVGVVLMSALLITPVGAALFFSRQSRVIILIAFVLGLAGGLGGTLSSYYIKGLPTGPSMVVFLSLIAIGSALFAPEKGILARWLRTYTYNLKVAGENSLKAIYLYQERTQLTGPYSPADRIFSFMPWLQGRIVFFKLLQEKYILKVEGAYVLTQKGTVEGMRIVRLHRLWEMYLAEELRVAPDHVHDEAESMEHFITPEIEKRLEAQLNYPSLDPHAKKIPRLN
jgi:manganese/zinc/iron transport system permease protein